MKKIDFYSHLNKVWMLALVAFMVACSQMEAPEPDIANMKNAEELASAFKLNPYGNGLENARVPSTGTASAPKSQGEITPYIIPGASQGGNRTCDEVATAYGIGSFDTSFEQINTPFTNNTATFGAITATTDGTFVSWSIEVPDGFCVKYLAAVVKGSNDANVYFYEGDVRSDAKLAAPENASGEPAGLSNLRFCYTLEEKPDAPIVKGDEACDEDGLVLRATLDGSIPQGYNLQWYTKNDQGEFEPVPANDPKLDEAGSKTYYAAFVNGCSSEMSEGAVLTINPLPTAPISGEVQEGDCDDMLTATVKNVPNGITIVWYDKDGNEVEDPSLSYDESLGGVQTVTYYAEAVDDETKCASERTAVTLTLNPCPPTECWTGESATGRGSAFPSGPSTWFQWNTRHQLTDGVNLVYGRNLTPIGRVTISNPAVGGMRTITVTLNEGIRFAEVSGALKVIASNTQFTRFSGFSGALSNATINGNTATIRVPDRSFYFVHGDIERIIECPVED